MPEQTAEETSQTSSKFWIYVIIGIIVVLVFLCTFYYFSKKKQTTEPIEEKSKGISLASEIDALKNEVKKISIAQETFNNDIRSVKILTSEIKNKISVGNKLEKLDENQ